MKHASGHALNQLIIVYAGLLIEQLVLDDLVHLTGPFIQAMSVLTINLNFTKYDAFSLFAKELQDQMSRNFYLEGLPTPMV